MAIKAETYHVPVLKDESIDGLCIRKGGIYADVTFGGGGHSREILARLGGTGHLYSFDQDADAERNIACTGGNMEDTAGEGMIMVPENFTFVRSNFRYIKNWMRYYDVEGLDGLLADLGVSSHHLDDETRGFSFRFDAPLDMRMNKRAGMTAADVLAELHTGSGLTAQEITEQGLPLPARDVLPETLLEKLICYADKFYSKSGSMERKEPATVRASLAAKSPEAAERFDTLRRLFG